jgi:hypothetical protein
VSIELCHSRHPICFVIPAKAGIQEQDSIITKTNENVSIDLAMCHQKLFIDRDAQYNNSNNVSEACKIVFDR